MFIVSCWGMPEMRQDENKVCCACGLFNNSAEVSGSGGGEEGRNDLAESDGW